MSFLLDPQPEMHFAGPAPVDFETTFGGNAPGAFVIPIDCPLCGKPTWLYPASERELERTGCLSCIVSISRIKGKLMG